MKNISVIIPTWNEEGNIKELIERIDKALTAEKISYEVIVVDDHSEDQTRDILQELQKKYPITIQLKKGHQGKAQSIIEGFEKAAYELICMIDADLQYPPEAIPEMILKANTKSDIVIANRKASDTSIKRKIASKAFNFVFARLLHGFTHDVQSGLKVFKKEIVERITLNPSPWGFDLEFLIKARDAGYHIDTVDITFSKRHSGEAKIGLLKAAYETGLHTIQLKFTQPEVIPFHPRMQKEKGKGFHYKGNAFITHNELHPSQTALYTLANKQKVTLISLIALFILGLLLNWHIALIILIAVLTTLYFGDLLFNLYLITRSFTKKPEIIITPDELKQAKDINWPMYTVFCPLYKEWEVLPQFITAMSNLDYPKNKLQVMLLLEEDDSETVQKAKNMKLPSNFEIVIVPESKPKTKPKAMNYGLKFTKGEYVVIYDAEDIPEKTQLKKAVLAFQKSNPKIVCIQAKLNFYNPHQNLLTRIFTSEYSLWFDLILTGLQSLQAPIPLGGTSNHFKVNILRQLNGWDSFNVTEDCDLGMRLVKNGYHTAIVESTTFEEANSDNVNWFWQRTRWIKGYVQSYIVHMRNPKAFLKSRNKLDFIAFQIIVGAKILSMLINPFFWIITIIYFAFRAHVALFIESFFPAPVLYMGVICIIFGNFLYMYYYMIGCAKRGYNDLIKYAFLIPFYWLAMSGAAWVSFYKLIRQPHFWSKTKHGLHLSKSMQKAVKEVVIQEEIKQIDVSFPSRVKNKIGGIKGKKKLYFSGLLLVSGTMLANILNFIFNIYLGRTVSLEAFGEVSLFTSLLYLTSIPFGSFSAAVSHTIALLYAKHSKGYAQGYMQYIMLKSIILGLIFSALWAMLTPFLSSFFHTASIFPILLFTPVWFISMASSNYSGYMAGTLSFGKKGLILFLEAATRLLAAIVLESIGLSNIIVLSIVISLGTSLFLSWILLKNGRSEKINIIDKKFNTWFFFTSALSGISIITFLTLDIILVKHFLDPVSAGKYGLLSLVGKMTYFLGSLFGPFMVPLIAHNEGEKKDSKNTFFFLFLITCITAACSFIGLGLLGRWIVPFIFGPKTLTILPLLIPYVLAMALFTTAQPIVSFFQAKENYSLTFVGFFVAIMQIILTTLFHKNLQQIVYVMLTTSLLNLFLMFIIYRFKSKLWIISTNLKDFFDLFKTFKRKNTQESTSKKRILIFNWRDTKHRWAGGAEVYVHELAKRWVASGNTVTVFCGSDGKNSRYEVIDGVEIIRRGGFYFVYIWAFLYYMLKLKDKYDVIIDSENGIPFFTPIYAKQEVFLLIHHVHQEVFRTSLKPPFSWLAQILELKIMPFVYKNVQVITVSPSSKKEILMHKLTETDPVIIYNGVNLSKFKPGQKAKIPVILYVGRLQFYKSLHIFIKAAQKILKKNPDVQIVIAGEGGERKHLQKLVEELSITKNITFLGKVTEEEKINLYQKAWIFVNPSRMEGWGITTIEANACGTPAVASDVPGLQDSVKHKNTGILVPYGDSDALAQEVTELIQNTSLRAQLSNNSLIWAMEFDWDISAKRLYSLIMQVSPVIERRGELILMNAKNKSVL